MKKLNGKYEPPPALSVIEVVRLGEAKAVEYILQYCDGYGNKLRLQTTVNENG